MTAEHRPRQSRAEPGESLRVIRWPRR
jgi:hypothetical protein